MRKFRIVTHGDTGTWYRIQEKIVGIFWVNRGSCIQTKEEAIEMLTFLKNASKDTQ